MMMDKATFAAGCFWHVEATFRKVNGVISTRVGYTGGRSENPTYEEVCSHNTGHAESVEVQHDPAVVSYDDLLNVFWEMHDPTTLNRQGPDVGSQYRSVIFYHTAKQKAAALASKDKLQATDRYRKRKIVTEIVPASVFYPAEEYHQRYLEKRGAVSCRICGTP
jgi:peptide-methionine (S)-S-oxide reductase